MRILTFFTLLIGFSGFSQKSSSEVYLDIQKLNSLKRVLYIAAHPDDENTRALAYFSLGEKAETAYLSLTRGDGGQNLIGEELSEDLGVLRTQELLAARSWDGATQFFTRAVDFGYSKSAKESLEKWGHNEILSDVVRVIRMFKPDVIITRFPADKRAGHGHHTASCMLALEAFDKAADSDYLPEQVKELGTWKTTSVYWNSSVWWDKSLGETAKNNPDYLITDIGGYNPLLGMSYNEIGTIARSQHKCQGFGAIIERGSRIEYFQYLKGAKLEKDFFEKNELTWSQFGSPELTNHLNQLINNFDFINLENNLESLFAVRTVLTTFKNHSIGKEKLKQCDEIITNCLGLYTQITAEDYSFISGQELKLNLEVLNRSHEPVEIIALKVNGFQTEINHKLNSNLPFTKELNITPNTSISSPYWLQNPFQNLFKVMDKGNLGKAENNPTLMGSLTVKIKNSLIQQEIPVQYIWKDPSYGERRREVISTPLLSANFDTDLTILKPGTTKKIRIKLHSFKNNLEQDLTLTAPTGWKITPEKKSVKFTGIHEEQWINFDLTATEKSQRGNLSLNDNEGNTLYSLTEIIYDHISTQTIFKRASMPCLALDAKINSGKVAYIKGVDDAVPLAIKELGFEVKVFEVSQLADLDLSGFKTVVLGIRIYNVHPELGNYEAKMFNYVKEGGNLIMQYNTASRSATETTYGPKPFQLSRNRVTEEDATVTFLAPNHPLLNSPNKITVKDFENWVQERGLYFANDWSTEYAPLLSWHDTGETEQKGALIVMKHGKGQFIYTGISFFRELPKGVEGAYRLFANMLSYTP